MRTIFQRRLIWRFGSESRNGSPGQKNAMAPWKVPGDRARCRCGTFFRLSFRRLSPGERHGIAGGADYFQSDWVRLNPEAELVTWRIDKLEKLVLEYLAELDYSTLAHKDNTPCAEELALAQTQTALDSATKQAEQIADAIEASGHSPTLLRRLADRERERAALELELERLKAALHTTKHAIEGMAEAKAAVAKLLKASDGECGFGSGGGAADCGTNRSLSKRL